jgi:hypothetical protein
MPAAPELDVEHENEAERVIRWRVNELERAGYDADSARALAERLDVDLHRAADLLRSGCPAETALKILL